LVTVNNVHPSLIFAGKSCSLSLVCNLSGKYETRVEVADSDKHTSQGRLTEEEGSVPLTSSLR